jgi:predicted O-methyltransferase YrrM
MVAPVIRHRGFTVKSFAHWTPRYVLDRAKQHAFSAMNPDAPWFTRHMVGLLDQLLRPDDRALEWGAGRSTLWLTRRVAHLVSIEHDPDWFERVRRRCLAELAAGRVELLLRRPADDGGDYVAAASTIAPDSLGLVVVDGKVRSLSALAALPLLRPGGLLVLDNAERYLPRATPSRAPGARHEADGYGDEAWRDFAARVAGWRCLWTTDGVTDTALWTKP